jgi:ABC-type transporter Mla subunit MlaD
MAYQENTASREMTPPEQLAQAAARLAQVSSELSEHGHIVFKMRADLHTAENSLTRSQGEFDDALAGFRQLLDTLGLAMSVPTIPDKRY